MTMMTTVPANTGTTYARRQAFRLMMRTALLAGSELDRQPIAWQPCMVLRQIDARMLYAATPCSAAMVMDDVAALCAEHDCDALITSLGDPTGADPVRFAGLVRQGGTLCRYMDYRALLDDRHRRLWLLPASGTGPSLIPGAGGLTVWGLQPYAGLAELMSGTARASARASTPRCGGTEMGARKKTPTNPAARKASLPAVTQPGVTGRSDNPLDWLFLLTSFPNFVFGVLRRIYRHHSNSINDFMVSKFCPVIFVDADGNRDEHAITAHRIGSVLPDEAPDAWDDPIVLAQAIEAAALPHEQALLIYVTLKFPEVRRLHTAWEEARAFALECLAKRRGLAVVLAHHAPHLMGSKNHQHVHLIVGARIVSPLGWAEVDRELTHDDGEGDPPRRVARLPRALGEALAGARGGGR